MNVRLLYIVSHPIQYQAPLLRRIARERNIQLKVLFENISEQATFDPGFGQEISWDIPLREGYESSLLTQTELNRALSWANVAWFHGWQSRPMRRALYHTATRGLPVLMRGENWEGAMPDGNGIRGWLKRRYLKWIFSHCGGFLAIGSANREYYIAHGIDPECIFPMPYAVDNAFFAEQAQNGAAERSKFLADLRLSKGRPIILYAGKFQKRKHPEHLLAAWRQARWNNGARPYLLFVGDGEMRAELTKDAEPDIRFLGFRNQTELPALYSIADVFVLPSEREAWGLAVNEAMACGTPVVVSDQVGCARDLVIGRAGRIVSFGDIDSLAQALQDVIADRQNASVAAKMAVADWDFEADVAGLKSALNWLIKRGMVQCA